jgi:hypothetical protein
VPENAIYCRECVGFSWPRNSSNQGMDIIGGITGAINLVKQMLKVAEKVKNAELMNSMADLQIELAKVKSQVAELLEENQQLKVVAKKETEKPQVVLKDGMYYTVLPEIRRS